MQICSEPKQIQKEFKYHSTKQQAKQKSKENKFLILENALLLAGLQDYFWSLVNINN